MSMRTAECFYVECDGCDDTEFGTDYTHHFDSAAEAEDHAGAADVFATTDGRHFCDRCIESGKAPAEVLEAAKAEHERWRRQMEEFDARRRRAEGQS